MNGPGTSGGTGETPPPRHLVVRTVVRATGSTTALVTIYYLLPLDTFSTAAAIASLTVGIALLIGLILYQVRAVVRSPHPALRAAEALATSVPLFLLLFAATYTMMSRVSAGDFSEPLTRTDALYFTVTVFATVGFGDITARTGAARLVVTGQMIANLVVIGVGIRVIVGAVSHSRTRRARQAGTERRPEGPAA